MANSWLLINWVWKVRFLVRFNGLEAVMKPGVVPSMAAPHVSGVAALIWSAYPELTNVEIREALDATALDLGDAGRDVYYGFGLVQAYDALQFLSGPGQGPKGPGK